MRATRGGPARRRALVAGALVFTALLAGNASAGTAPPRTGDRSLDGALAMMNALDASGRDALVDDIVERFGAPRYLVKELLGPRHWQPGDVYLACALAYHLRLPCADVARDFEQDTTRGWGDFARASGIRPGSAAFAALKDQARESAARVDQGATAGTPGDGQAPTETPATGRGQK